MKSFIYGTNDGRGLSDRISLYKIGNGVKRYVIYNTYKCRLGVTYSDTLNEAIDKFIKLVRKYDPDNISDLIKVSALRDN